MAEGGPPRDLSKIDLATLNVNVTTVATTIVPPTTTLVFITATANTTTTTSVITTGTATTPTPSATTTGVTTSDFVIPNTPRGRGLIPPKGTGARPGTRIGLRSGGRTIEVTDSDLTDTDTDRDRRKKDTRVPKPKTKAEDPRLKRFPPGQTVADIHQNTIPTNNTPRYDGLPPQQLAAQNDQDDQIEDDTEYVDPNEYQGPTTRSRGPALFDQYDLDTYLRAERFFQSALKKMRKPVTEIPFDKVTSKDLERMLDIDQSDAISEHSVMSAIENMDGDDVGFKRLLTHIVKPVANVWDPEMRIRPEARERSMEHLRRVSKANVNRAIKTEPFFMLQQYHMNRFARGLELLQLEINNLKNDTHIKERAKIEKKGKIRPNDPGTYPRVNAQRSDWIKAVTEMRAQMTIVDRSFSFKDRPYDYLLEACGASNVIASFYRLSKEQQKALITGSVPVLSHVHKEIKMLNTLEEIFDLASLSCTTLYTKLELDSLIEAWRINLESYATMNESLGRLKCLISDASDLEVMSPNLLYSEMVKRIKRERLPGYILRNLDDLTLRIAREDNLLVMHEYLLAALKPGVGWKGRSGVSNGTNGGPQIHKLEENELLQLEGPSDDTPTTSLFKALVHQLSDTPIKDNKNHNKNDRGRSQNKKHTQNTKQKNTQNTNTNTKQNTGHRDKQQQIKRNDRSQSRPRYVQQWPKNKNYLNKSGNQLTDEVLRHFSGFCFRCGLGNHRASDCRFYDRSAILTLCNVCWSGFHDKCKNPKYRDQNQNSGQKAIAQPAVDIKKLEDKIEMLEKRPNYPFYYPLPPPMYPGLTMKTLKTDDSSGDE
jgi:hypothetical protein